MEHTAGTTTADLIDRLDNAGEAPPGPARDDVVAALDRAGGDGTAPEEASALDGAALRAMLGGRREEALTRRIPLDRLEALADRCARRLEQDDPAAPEFRERARAFLDVVRRPGVLTRIERATVPEWAERIVRLIDLSEFTVGPLFRQRAEQYGRKVLFRVDGQGRGGEWNWRRAAARVEFLSRVLLALDPADEPAPIAILSENRLEMALLDLACLTAGLINVMVPANASESDVGYILEHSGAGTVIVSGREQLAKVLPHRDRLGSLRHVVTIDAQAASEPGVTSLEALAPRAEETPRTAPKERSERVRSGDLATIMYTSGTTGTPKGIQFSHRNIVSKRFARALALPAIGDEDVFVSFLPLCHTFGRYFEMLGCVFWGATYCLLDRTSPKALVQAMRAHRPTVFISVPKKWIQLHEMISRLADPVEASDEELLAATHRITGGRLRWGLSAAGHLDSDIFRFFQHQGVELMSGFGMTEATGGITMTPPGEYEDGSLGVALPGIEVRLADDGELLVRGPYVMIGYLDPPDGEAAFDADGWLHSGDLMEVTPAGHLRLVDRKKEIYKNIKGETIAPQRVENLFREFDSVGRAFLVGDHRDFNTLLIHPNPEYAEIDLASLSEQEIRDHFRSLVVSVNQFLAPYERVVDFAVISRDLESARGELTAKGTPRRKVVERNFADVIRELYRRASLRVGGVELVIPNWLLQILGITVQDIRFSDDAISLPSRGTRIDVRARGAGSSQVGSCVYSHPSGPLDLGGLLTTPRLWLGNEQLVSFVHLDTVTRRRTRRRLEEVRWADHAGGFASSEEQRATLASLADRSDLDLMDLDLAARMLASNEEVDGLLAIRVLEEIVARDEPTTVEPARHVLARAAVARSSSVRRRAFQVLAPAEKDGRFAGVLRRFSGCDPELFDSETRLAIADHTLSRDKIEAVIALARSTCEGRSDKSETCRLAEGLLGFLATYGAGHPTSYRRIRAFCERMRRFARHERVRNASRDAAHELVAGFRTWLGPAARVAVDPDRGREYRWRDVVFFEESIPPADRERLLAAMRETAFIREAVFLFTSGTSIELADVAPDGVRVRLLGRLHGKSVYRITVQTRFQGVFDLAANVNHDLNAEEVREECGWLVLCGDPGAGRDPLVEEFGGYWPDQGLWSEEFIAGETLFRSMRSLSGLPDPEERVTRMWPFWAWATLSAYVDFWNRSGRRLEIGDPDMKNVIVPTRDFLSGVRIVSVSRRREHAGLFAMLRAFLDEFVAQAEEHYPYLRGVVGWPVIFSSVLEVVGEDEGIELLERALAEGGRDDDDFAGALAQYVGAVRERGFIPMRLFFAANRFRRWAALSRDATPQARALTLQELYDTYGLRRLVRAYPETRVQFYRETVFRDAHPALDEGLNRIIRGIREEALAPDDLVDAVDDLRGRADLGPDDQYFLARLSYPHLRPQDDAGFVRRELGGRRQSDLVVTLEDADGASFRVRHAMNPKEVERLLRLFLAAKLDVRFRMEHQFLVAINERSQIIGGVYYETDDEARSAHLEKIVAADRYRGKRVAHGLMIEFINRLRSAGFKTLTTGFFRPEYFYGYGFKVEKQHAGLVKDLTEADAPGETA